MRASWALTQTHTKLTFNAALGGTVLVFIFALGDFALSGGVWAFASLADVDPQAGGPFWAALNAIDLVITSIGSFVIVFAYLSMLTELYRVASGAHDD